MNHEIITLLEKHFVKPTPMRMLVLEQFVINNNSLSLDEIENLLYPSDRITIYRTLNTFEKNGLIHKIENQNKGTNYALCSNECDIENHIDTHPHFFCEKCLKIFCTDIFKFKIEENQLTSRYLVKNINIKITGICDKCLKISN